LERYEDLDEMIEAVSKYYKTSLNFGNDFITVSDNVAQLQSYAKIQMIRFKNKFCCDFRIDPKTHTQKIPIFILQPLLENAICHGLEPKEDYGIIRVTVRQRKGDLICTIEDNGIGIEKGKLAEIRNSLNEDTLASNRFFALANINKRIKISYGQDYGLKIISKKGYGTKVTLTMPITSELEGRKDV
jgi:two-component system, sensor histidine kinase YesM